MNTPFILWHPEPVPISGCYLIRKKVMRLTKCKSPPASLAFLPITIHSVKCTLIDRNHQNLQLKSSVVMVSNPLWTCTNYHRTLTGSIIIKSSRNLETTTVPVLHGYSRSQTVTWENDNFRFPDWLWRICGTAQCVTTPNVR